MNVTIVGAGAWGTALAKLLCEAGHHITIWGHDPEHLREFQESGRNERYLPGVVLPRDWRFETSLSAAVDGSQTVVLAVPSKAFRDVTRHLSGYSGIAISVTKGIEHVTGLTMSGILRENMPRANEVALSGPTLAFEVAQNTPSAIVAASHHAEAAQAVQTLFHRPTFRVYTSSDLLGVELGGALKNVIAIAAGVSDGLGFGDNAKAALLTRGIVEMRKLGVACGAQAETFSGLSGLGDLTVTCFSRLSRNRGLGERLGRGESLTAILESTTSIAEGYPTARSAFDLAKRHAVCTPIIDETYAMLFEKKNMRKALHDLTNRESKAED